MVAPVLPLSILSAGARSLASMQATAAVRGFNGSWYRMADSVTAPITREAGYWANRAFRNLIPSAEQVASLFYARKMPEADLQRLFAFTGIDWTDRDRVVDTAWRESIELGRPILDLGSYKKFWRQGRLNQNKARDVLTRNGITNPDDMDLWMFEFENIPEAVILAGWLRGFYNDVQVQQLLGQHGYLPAAIAAFKESAKAAFSPFESLALFNRRDITSEDLDRQLKRVGLVDDREREQFKRLRLQIPSPSELINFSVREVWDENVVKEFGYDDEFPEPFRFWMEKQGYDWGQAVPLGPEKETENVHWPKAWWRAHWYMVSPTEAFHMLHRLRGDPANPASWRVPGVKPFTMEDVNRVLKIHDYPPALRDRLAATSYRVLRLFDVRRAVQLEVRDKAWAVGKFQDMGYTAEDSLFSADLAIAQEAEKRRRKLLNRHEAEQGKLRQTVIEQYQLGIISQEQAFEALKALDILAETARLMLQRADIELQGDLVKAVIRRAKQDWMNGRISDGQAATRMMQSGLTGPRAAWNLDRWRVERGESWLQFTTTKVVDLVKRRLLTFQQGMNRLTNLGWANPEGLLLMAGAWQDINRMDARALEVALQRKSKQAAELKRLINETRRAKERYQAALRRTHPIGQMKAWLRKKIIGLDYFVDTLRAAGYPDEVIRKEYLLVTGEELPLEVGNEPPEEAPEEEGTGVVPGLEEELSEEPGGSGSGSGGGPEGR